MKIEKARISHLAHILKLLEENQLPVEGVAENLKNFIVLKKRREFIGCAGLEVHGKIGLLRSIAVRMKNRGQGLGTSLVEKMLELCRKKKIKRVYLLTTTAAGFFKKFGFEPISRDDVDQEICQTAEFTHLCPLSAVVMFKNISVTKRAASRF